MSHNWKSVKTFVPLGFVLCIAAGFGAIGAAPLARVSPQKNKDAKPTVPTTGLAPDKGKFRISLAGQVVGKEEFEISSSDGTWSARGSTTAHAPGGGDIKATGHLTLGPDGAPMHYDWTAEAQKKGSGVVDFVNGTSLLPICRARPTVRLEGWRQAGLSSPDSSRHDAGKHIGGIDRPAAGRQHEIRNLARQFTGPGNSALPGRRAPPHAR